MSNGSPRLGHIEPRERAGAQTGRKYEYQYERTARAALDLPWKFGEFFGVQMKKAAKPGKNAPNDIIVVR